MTNDKIMRIYVAVLFILSSIFIIFEILKQYFLEFEILSWIGFIVLLGLFVVWGIVRIVLHESDLSNFELVTMLLTSVVSLSKLPLIFWEFFGTIGWNVFGLWPEDFLLILFFIFLFIATIFWFIRLQKGLKTQNKRKIKLNKIDIFFILFFAIIIILLILYYVFE